MTTTDSPPCNVAKVFKLADSLLASLLAGVAEVAPLME